jgi:hypothetical protein
MTSTAAPSDYTPRESTKNKLVLPSPLRVKNYLRIKKPTIIMEEKNSENGQKLEENKFP